MKSNREIVNMALNRKACNGKFKVGDKVKSNYGVSGSGTIMKITPSTGWLGNTLEVKWDDGDITHPCEGQVHLSNSTACNGGTDYYIEYKNGKKEAFHGFGEGAIERKLRNNPLVDLYGGVKKITLEDGSEYKVKNAEEVATNASIYRGKKISITKDSDDKYSATSPWFMGRNLSKNDILRYITESLRELKSGIDDLSACADAVGNS